MNLYSQQLAHLFHRYLYLPLPYPALCSHNHLQVLHRVLGHLLRNSAAATPSGGRITLRISHEEQNASWAGHTGSRVRFEVRDNGCGMPKTDNFRRYYSGSLPESSEAMSAQARCALVAHGRS